MKFHIPLVLTFVRLVLSPAILPFLLVGFLPCNELWLNSLLAAVFLCFGITDFLDGYLARKLQQETVLGKILDPIADKFLLASVLIALLAVKKIYFFWVLIFIGRELFIMGLRHVALEYSVPLPVTALGKWKTAAQFVCVTLLIMNPYYQDSYTQAPWWNYASLFILLGAVTLTIGSAWHYYQTFMDKCGSKVLRLHR